MGSAVSSYTFTLDGNGNRKHSTQTEPLGATDPAGATVYEYNTQRNRLLSAGAVNYTYDDEGRLQAAGSASFTFDCDQRLIGIDTGTQFFYDGRGNRLKAIRGGVTTYYIYDPWGNLLAEADANGITRKCVYGNGLLALATSLDLYCYHFDATGNTIALTDMAQTVVNSYVYEPFGQILAQQETIAQPFKFVGRYGVMAEQNGIYYMRARYYDPSVGRFISEDPLGFGGGDVNLFAYVQSNPIDRIDPLEMKWKWILLPVPIPDPPFIVPFPLPFPMPDPTPTNPPAPIKREPTPNSDPGNAKPDELPEPWPSGDDWRGQCIRLYTLCENQGWSGRCGECLNKCTAQYEWPFENCAPRRGCQ